MKSFHSEKLSESPRSSGLYFDEENHKYFYDGIQAPSVTTVLKNERFFDDTWFTEEAKIRGSVVHKATELLDHGKLDWFNVKEEYIPRVKAWELFKSDYDFRCEPINIELRGFHPLYRYAGTFDRLCHLGPDNSWWLIDIKTGPKYAWWPLQLGGYLEMLRFIEHLKSLSLGVANVNCGCVELRKDGSYKLHSYAKAEMVAAYKTFLNAVNIYNWKTKNGVSKVESSEEEWG